MTMDGRRFGIGLGAGLLIGLVVVTLSAGLASGSVFAPAGLSEQVARNSVTTVTLSTTTTAVTLTTQQNGSFPPVAQGNSSYVVFVTSTSGASTPSKSLEFVPTGSADLQGIASQAPLTSAILFVPVVVAFVLGAVAYMVSRQGRAEPDED